MEQQRKERPGYYMIDSANESGCYEKIRFPAWQPEAEKGYTPEDE